MKPYILVLTITLFAACDHKQPSNDKAKWTDAKKFFDTMPEPLLASIPDSFRMWVPIFDTIYRNDNKFRSLEDQTLFQKHKFEQRVLDSINQVKVSAFLDRYGYPRIRQVGMKAMMAIRMVILHGTLEMQEKYYPLTVDAYKQGKIVGEVLALLEDRINMRNKRYQFYGTQLISYKNKMILYPVYNVDSIDVYRKKIGCFTTISAYLKPFKITWDPEEYKRVLPDLVKENNVSNSIVLHMN